MLSYASALLCSVYVFLMIFHEKPHLIHHDFGYVGRFGPKQKHTPIDWAIVKAHTNHWTACQNVCSGFVDKSQFHACRLMFAFKKYDPPWWRENVLILSNSSLPFEIFLEPQESANARRFSFAVAGTISWTVCLCVCVCAPLWMQYASWHASWHLLTNAVSLL